MFMHLALTRSLFIDSALNLDAIFDFTTPQKQQQKNSSLFASKIITNPNWNSKQKSWKCIFTFFHC